MGFSSQPSRLRAIERALTGSGVVAAILLPGMDPAAAEEALAVVEEARKHGRETVVVRIAYPEAPAP